MENEHESEATEIDQRELAEKTAEGVNPDSLAGGKNIRASIFGSDYTRRLSGECARDECA